MKAIPSGLPRTPGTDGGLDRAGHPPPPLLCAAARLDRPGWRWSRSRCGSCPSCGVLAVPAIYVAGRRMLSRRAALIATLLLAISPLHVYYSQEVRMYGLVALLSIGVLAAAWEVLERESASQQTPALAPKRSAGASVSKSADHPVTPSPRHLVTLSTDLPTSCSPPAALYTQYYAVFLPIGLTLYVCWRWRRDGSSLARWLAAQIVVAVLYSPWVIYAAPKLVPYVSQKVVQDADKPLSLVMYFARHLSAFSVGHLEGPPAGWWPAAALLLLVPLIVGGCY